MGERAPLAHPSRGRRPRRQPLGFGADRRARPPRRRSLPPAARLRLLPAVRGQRGRAGLGVAGPEPLAASLAGVVELPSRAAAGRGDADLDGGLPALREPLPGPAAALWSRGRRRRPAGRRADADAGRPGGDPAGAHPAQRAGGLAALPARRAASGRPTALVALAAFSLSPWMVSAGRLVESDWMLGGMLLGVLVLASHRGRLATATLWRSARPPSSRCRG